MTQINPAQMSAGQAAPGWPRRVFAAVKGPIIVLALVFATRTVVAQPFYVPSASMEPTLLIGDELIVSKFAYGYSRYSLPLDPGVSFGRLFGKLPAYGDVVVFRLPRDPEQVYVKRVVGLPGDTVQMRDARLWINGAELPLAPDGSGPVEDGDGRVVTAARYIETMPGGYRHPIFKLSLHGALDDTDVYTVPPGHVFMMGDNRDDSLDSRVSPASGGVGFVPMENLIGRADIVLGSWDFPVMRRPVWQWASGLRLERFFSRIR